MSGGINVNSVPDEARLGVDVRLVPGVDRERLIERFRKATGGGVTFEVLGTSDAVWTDPEDPWVREVSGVVQAVTGRSRHRRRELFHGRGDAEAPDGQSADDYPRPGRTPMAHQTDEWCSIKRIEEAETIFSELIVRWCGL